jgi:hypothetical protein
VTAMQELDAALADTQTDPPTSLGQENAHA